MPFFFFPPTKLFFSQSRKELPISTRPGMVLGDIGPLGGNGFSFRLASAKEILGAGEFESGVPA